MKQAIAGVSPASTQEVTVMITWPSIARYLPGRILGRAFENQAGVYVLTVGNVVALCSIPLVLPLYFFRLAPSFFGLPLHGSMYM